MRSLSGSYLHTVDSKNRLRVPAKFKAKLENDPLVMTKGTEKCLNIMTESTVDLFWKTVNEDKEITPEARHALRNFSAFMFDVEEDAQGRFTIPSKLREYANITKDVIFIGFNNRIELWDLAEWERSNSNSDEEVVMSCLAKYGM